MIFKYKNVFYQDVNNFCNDYGELKKQHSDAMSNIVSTTFPTSAYLWKNGTQDLSDLHGAAYILGQRKKPTGTHLLLVSQKQLKQAAASCVTKSNWIRAQLGLGKSHVPHKRPAKILGRQHRSWIRTLKAPNKHAAQEHQNQDDLDPPAKLLPA